MFEKNAIIYLTKSRIWACKEDKTSRFVDLLWNEENLIKVIGQIKKKLRVDNFKIILGGDISYAFALKEKAELSRKEILARAKETVPESIDNDSFDWQEVGRYENNEELVQVCGISKNVLNILSLSCQKNKINVEFMLPVSILLSWQGRKVDFPSLLLWSGQENLAVITQAGIVYDCQVLGDNVESKVKEIVENAKEKFGFDLKSLILDIKKWEGVSQIFPSWQENHYELDPFLEMSKHNQTKGEDEEILELNTRGEMDNQKIEEEEIKINKYDEEIVEEFEIQNSDEQVSLNENQIINNNEGQNMEEENVDVVKEKPNSKWKIIMFAVIGIVLLMGLGIGGFFIFGNKEKKNEVKQVVEVTPMPTPTPIDLTIYKIKVLNGSGIEGDAGIIKDVLEKVGFKISDTGNADGYNYKQTEIRYKEKVPEEVLVKIEEVLSDHESTRSGELKNDDDYDVIIVSGSKKTVSEKTVIKEKVKEATESGEKKISTE